MCFSLDNLVRGYEYAQNVPETEYTAVGELSNNNCENENELSVGTAVSDKTLYIFNKKY